MRLSWKYAYFRLQSFRQYHIMGYMTDVSSGFDCSGVSGAVFFYDGGAVLPADFYCGKAALSAFCRKFGKLLSKC